jgi:hypothetical protein
VVTPTNRDDPRRMKPGALRKLLNSTPLGEVVTDQRLYKQRQKPDGKFSDGKHIDLLRYAAWLGPVPAESRRHRRYVMGCGQRACPSACC